MHNANELRREANPKSLIDWEPAWGRLMRYRPELFLQKHDREDPPWQIVPGHLPKYPDVRDKGYHSRRRLLSRGGSPTWGLRQPNQNHPDPPLNYPTDIIPKGTTKSDHARAERIRQWESTSRGPSIWRVREHGDSNQPKWVFDLPEMAHVRHRQLPTIDQSVVDRLVKYPEPDAYIVDVRPNPIGAPSSVLSVPLSSIVDSFLLPPSTFEAEFGRAQPRLTDYLVVISSDGTDAEIAGWLLQEAGYENVVNFRPGAAGLGWGEKDQVDHPWKTIEKVMRQVDSPAGTTSWGDLAPPRLERHAKIKVGGGGPYLHHEEDFIALPEDMLPQRPVYKKRKDKVEEEGVEKEFVKQPSRAHLKSYWGPRRGAKAKRLGLRWSIDNAKRNRRRGVAAF